jgi:hypothetical protein
MKPWKISLILLAGSLVLTVVFWMTGLPFFFLFLFIPFIPFLAGPQKTRHCPACGWETRGNERFCPYDATPLENVRDSE